MKLICEHAKSGKCKILCNFEGRIFNHSVPHDVLGLGVCGAARCSSFGAIIVECVQYEDIPDFPIKAEEE